MYDSLVLPAKSEYYLIRLDKGRSVTYNHLQWKVIACEQRFPRTNLFLEDYSRKYPTNPTSLKPYIHFNYSFTQKQLSGFRRILVH